MIVVSRLRPVHPPGRLKAEAVTKADEADEPPRAEADVDLWQIGRGHSDRSKIDEPS